MDNPIKQLLQNVEDIRENATGILRSLERDFDERQIARNATEIITIANNLLELSDKKETEISSRKLTIVELKKKF